MGVAAQPGGVEQSGQAQHVTNGDIWQIAWDHGEADVYSLGAMVGPVRFHLGDGEYVQPFQVAPWVHDGGGVHADQHAALPPILQNLRGEWPCVPFGMPDALTDLPPRWLSGLTHAGADGDAAIHGAGANMHWQLVSRQPHAVSLAVEYPDTHPIARVTRTIAGVAGEAALNFSLLVEARRDVDLPIGLHPVVRLPKEAGAAYLSFAGDVAVHSYPVAAEKGVSRVLPDQQDMPLDRIVCSDGSYLDASRHPLPMETEELLLVTGHGGAARLENSVENYALALAWDEADFPACMLWISNRGRQAYPWSGRFQALGIEPVAAAFDLGVAHSQNPANPLTAAGLRCTQVFSAGVPRAFSYRISVASLEVEQGLQKRRN